MVSTSAAGPPFPGFGAAEIWLTSLSFLSYVNFLAHLSQRTTLTNTLFDYPFSIHAKGSSTVLRCRVWSSGWGAWLYHLVLPHVVLPEPDRTSDSVRQSRLKYFELGGRNFSTRRVDVRCRIVVFEVACGKLFVHTGYRDSSSRLCRSTVGSSSYIQRNLCHCVDAQRRLTFILTDATITIFQTQSYPLDDALRPCKAILRESEESRAGESPRGK